MGICHRHRRGTLPQGLNEDIVRLISAKKKEPEFMLDWRLKAFRHWASLERSRPSRSGRMSSIRRSIIRTFSYYSAPKQKTD